MKTSRLWAGVRYTAFCWLLTVIAGSESASAQTLIANDDEYGVPYGMALIVEAFGTLDNDLLNGDPAGENGATAELVSDVSHGTLSLAMDGSLSYSPGATFDGLDSFVYRAVFESSADTATVSLTACTGGPQIFTCWNESAFLAKTAELGYSSVQESFEDDAVWGIARSPATAPSVSGQGIQWQTNHAGDPAFNEISTASGAARTGLWGIYDPNHGYATGTSTECDIDNPPAQCLFHDGFTGLREPSYEPLHGVGGYFHGTYGANVGISIDGAAPIGGGQIYLGYQFFGVVDAGPMGFTQFEFRELDGKVGQELLIFGDDFTLLASEAVDVPEPRGSTLDISFSGPSPNPSSGSATLRFSLPPRVTAKLSIHDQRGRLVRQLVDGARGGSSQVVTWDGRDRDGTRVPSGIYFARLIVEQGAKRDVVMRKIVIAR